MGKAFSKAGGAAAGGFAGAFAGAVAGVKLGKELGMKGMSELVYDATKTLVLRKASEQDPKSENIKDLKITIEDKSTAICAALSAWVYSFDARLLVITKYSLCYQTEEQLKDPKAEAFLELTTDCEPVRVLQDGKIDGKVWVKVVVGGCEVYLWLGEHKLQGGKIDILSPLRDKLCRELKLVKREEIKRAVYGSGGVLCPSFISVIIRDDLTQKTTLYTVWQGTMFEKRPMDLLMDLAAAPVRAGLWDTVYPHLWVHSGFHAKVHHDFCTHRETILTLIKEFAVNKIIFTGHSLGGALARVAHVGALVEFERMSSNHKRDVQKVDIQSITFAAPMVFFKPDIREVEVRKRGDSWITCDTLLLELQAEYEAKPAKEKAEESFNINVAGCEWEDLQPDTATQEKLGQLEAELLEKSVNHFFDKDIIPQLPGHHQFFKPAIKMAARTAVTEFVPLWKGRLEELVDKFCHEALDMYALEKTLVELGRYSHLCQLLHFKSRPDGTSFTLDTLSSESDMPRWEEDPGDTWRYLLTCHSVLPHSMHSSEPS
mmetsp:Transcript_108032/g.214610  ORF Transcript_108032/g.214610 Transcript_108032/m.214610 type:complete len:544 (+) Transcript_108032:55-1686(+)